MFSARNIRVLLGIAVAGCSGTSTRTVPADLEDNSTKIPPFAKPDSTETAPSQPAPAAAPAPTASVDRPTVDSKDRTPAPPPECPAEAEPNNGADDATEFTGCVTGELTGWTDVDTLAIKAPDDAVEMVIDHVETRGKIQYQVTVGGGAQQNFNMSFTDKAPQTKVTPGKTYLFNLKWDNNGQGAVTDVRPYMIRVAFTR
jgi:hypothetical protein